MSWLIVAFHDLLFFSQGPAYSWSAHQDNRPQGKDRGCVQEEVNPLALWRQNHPFLQVLRLPGGHITYTYSWDV